MNKRIKVTQKTLDGDFIQEYDSIADAANNMRVNESTIRRALNNESKTAKEYRWYTSDNTKKYIPNGGAKIFLFDIETSPTKAYVWRMWKENIGLAQIIDEWMMLTWAGKWLGDDIIHSEKCTGDEVLEEDDKRILRSLWKFIDEADIVIAHNCKKFDVPKMNSRFILNGMPCPSPYKQIDTLEIAKRHFGFNKNSLDALAGLFGYEGKADTDFILWKNCKEGKEDSLIEMENYNIQDINVLENIYFELRPYMKGHPNLDLYSDDGKPKCPSCGSISIKPIKDKYYYTQSIRYPIYRCENCMSVCRSKQGEKFEYKKRVMSIPR